MGGDPLLGAGVEALGQYLEHGKIEDWGRVGSAGGGGIAGGLIAVSNPAAALSTVMSAGAGSSALAGVTERLIASGGKSAGTLTEVAVDAATGAGSAGIVKGGASLLRKVLPKKVAPPASKGAVAKAGVSEPDGLVFWSGSRTANHSAETYAKATGQTTLEMTARGRALEAAELPWAHARPLWQEASRDFATNAAGKVDVFIGAVPREQSIWRTIEKPILESSPNVLEIRVHLPILD